MTYLELLEKTARENNSIVCMGLDPVIKMLPEDKQDSSYIYSYLLSIIHKAFENGILPGAFKPNEGYYSIHDLTGQSSHRFFGSDLLFEIMHAIKEYDEDYKKQSLIILDSKRGDIGPSSANYAIEAFERFEADAITVSPYMGDDSINPFSAYCKKGKGVYVLCCTSNPGRKRIQELELKDGRLVYEAVADTIIEWAKDTPGVGAVVGATSLAALERLAKIFAKHLIPLLIPGVGGQGGSAKEVVDILRKVGYPLYLARINSSSGITHPWVKKGLPTPKDYDLACLEELDKLNKEIGPIF